MAQPTSPAGDGADARVGVVVLTHDRAAELARCLQRIDALPERPPVVVVDNASRDRASVDAVAARFARMHWLSETRNLGAAGRNAGVAALRTPYVAFCDDDSGWQPGALQRAAELLDTHPRVGAVVAHVVVGAERRPDPICAQLAASPLDSAGLPGRSVLGFLACAVVMRRDAFVAAGGYERRLFVGGEETLLALDLAAAGLALVYRADVVALHEPSPHRDPPQRRLVMLRNRIWTAWLRLPAALAWRESAGALRDARAQGLRARVLRAVLREAPWLLARRRPVPRAVASMWAQLQGSEPAPAARPRSG